jgi:hypothetical protein
MKDLGTFIDAKFRFHKNVKHIFSHCIKLLGPVRSVIFTLSSLKMYSQITHYINWI